MKKEFQLVIYLVLGYMFLMFFKNTVSNLTENFCTNCVAPIHPSIHALATNPSVDDLLSYKGRTKGCLKNPEPYNYAYLVGKDHPLKKSYGNSQQFHPFNCPI